MITPTPGPLRPPRSAGFMSANMVLPLYDVLGEYKGTRARDEIFSEAGIRYLPGPEDPVRERQVNLVHQGIRQRFPAQSKEIFSEAALIAADVVAEYRIPASGKTMLRKLPWPLATWMLVRSAHQHAWTFGGSGQFKANTTAKMDLIGNPSIRGAQSDKPLCHFHAALFQRLFRTLVHPRMICVEHKCEAAGDDCCRFELSLPPEEADANV